MADKSPMKDILYGVKRKPDEPELPLAEEEDLDDVGPCGWVWVKGCRAIDIECGAAPVISLQYVFAAVRSEFTPTRFWMMFEGTEAWKVTVEGRNLRALYDRMQDHCLRRIRQSIRDFGQDDGKPVVTRIEVSLVTPEDEEPRERKKADVERDRQVPNDKPIMR